MPAAMKTFTTSAVVGAALLEIGSSVDTEVMAVAANGGVKADGRAAAGGPGSRKRNRGGWKKPASGSASSQVMAVDADGAVEDINNNGAEADDQASNNLDEDSEKEMGLSATAAQDKEDFRHMDNKGDGLVSLSEHPPYEHKKENVVDAAGSALAETEADVSVFANSTFGKSANQAEVSVFANSTFGKSANQEDLVDAASSALAETEAHGDDQTKCECCERFGVKNPTGFGFLGPLYRCKNETISSEDRQITTCSNEFSVNSNWCKMWDGLSYKILGIGHLDRCSCCSVGENSYHCFHKGGERVAGSDWWLRQMCINMDPGSKPITSCTEPEKTSSHDAKKMQADCTCCRKINDFGEPERYCKWRNLSAPWAQTRESDGTQKMTEVKSRPGASFPHLKCLQPKMDESWQPMEHSPRSVESMERKIKELGRTQPWKVLKEEFELANKKEAEFIKRWYPKNDTCPEGKWLLRNVSIDLGDAQKVSVFTQHDGQRPDKETFNPTQDFWQTEPNWTDIENIFNSEDSEKKKNIDFLQQNYTLTEENAKKFAEDFRTWYNKAGICPEGKWVLRLLYPPPGAKKPTAKKIGYYTMKKDGQPILKDLVDMPNFKKTPDWDAVAKTLSSPTFHDDIYKKPDKKNVKELLMGWHYPHDKEEWENASEIIWNLYEKTNGTLPADLPLYLPARVRYMFQAPLCSCFPDADGWASASRASCEGL